MGLGNSGLSEIKRWLQDVEATLAHGRCDLCALGRWLVVGCVWEDLQTPVYTVPNAFVKIVF